MSVGDARTDEQSPPLGVAVVGDLAASLRSVMARFDPAVVTTTESADLVRLFDEIERMGAAGKALSAVRVAQAPRLLRAKGFKDGADYLARTTGVTTGDAVAMLATVEAMVGLDATTEAFKTGRLAPRQASAVAGAARANPAREGEMLDLASTGSLRDVQERSRRIRTDASSETDEQRAARLHRRRSLRAWIDADTGEGCGSWRLPPAEHAQIMSELNRRKDRIFRRAREECHREADPAYLADALVELLTPTPAGESPDGTSESGIDGVTGRVTDEAESIADQTQPSSAPGTCTRWNTKVIVRVDHAALVRGRTEPGEVCEIAGVGAIPVAHARQLIASDAFKAAIVTRGTDIRSVVHLGRRPLGLQVTALEWVSGGRCQIRGCTSGSGRLEIDHVEDWAHTGRTTLDQLALACGHHHDLKTLDGWGFGPLAPDGTRDTHPPAPPPSGPIDQEAHEQGDLFNSG